MIKKTEIEHNYGSQVHVLDDLCLSSWLSQLCLPETTQPQINVLVEFLYVGLLKFVLNHEFPAKQVRLATRMTALHPEAHFEGQILEAEQRVVSVNLARAGTYPSHVCYNLLNNVLHPRLIRQDHILASRTIDDGAKVTGTSIGGTKIGGDVRDAIVLFPDPMGATGNTLVSALNHYKKDVGGGARAYVALHLIVTPEYLRRVRREHPDLIIYAVRVDRGLSSAKVLQSIPGTHWDEEFGLNDKQYIVPGGGGFGEVMNNSFV